MRRHRSRLANTPVPIHAPERLWTLRILIPMGALKRLVQDTIGNHEIFVSLGVGDPELDKLTDPDRYKLLQPRVTEAWREAEAVAARVLSPKVLRENLDRLGVAFGFDATDVRLLEWSCLVATSSVLSGAVSALGDFTTHTAMDALANILDISRSKVQSALGRSGSLIQSGLLSLEAGDSRGLGNKISLLDQSIVDALHIPDISPLHLIRRSVREGPPPRLTLGEFPHLERDLTTLIPYLRKAHDDRRAGVNVLLYGPPGTGKTELARALARELGSELLEVVSEDDDGDLIGAVERVQAYTAAQRLLARSRSMLLFDECSDAFADRGPGAWTRSHGRSLHGGKAWFNQMLERNPVPTFWLTNDPSAMDPALLRRFDMVIEMGVPPRSVRQKIAKACCGAFVSPAMVDLLAECEVLAPAVLDRASSVVATLAAEPGVEPSDATLLRLVNQTLRVQGHAEIRAQNPTRLPEIYDPSLVNSEADLRQLADGIGRAGSARLCLYGPPGTGKSAYGRWLAKSMGKSLLLRRASDLVSMWVGQTERNIANAFRTAEQEGAVLLIDEVDGFLRDRRAAQRSWEVTEVNEMLTQMEAFAGVFVATTNLVDELDPAALRRFDLKAHFGYLRAEQVAELLRRHCSVLGLDAPDPGDLARVSQLGNLTPGDFAAVVRRHAFQHFASPRVLIDALAGECSLKAGGRQAIGFIVH